MDLLQFVGASVDLNTGCLRVGRYEALLKESSERIQLVEFDVIAHGENVGLGEMVTPLAHKDTRTMSAVHNLDEADYAEHARVFLTETTLFPPLNVRTVLVKIVGRNNLRALEAVMIEPDVTLPSLCVLFSAGKIQV